MRIAAARLSAAGPAVVGLAAYVALLFAEALFGRAVFYQRDVHAYWLPLAETFGRVVRQGARPLWDPYETFGLPLLADPGSQVFYPTTWLNLFLMPGTAYTAFVVVHAWAAGTGLALLGRRCGLSWPSSTLAGVGWTASGPLLSLAGMHQHFAGAAWMPWVVLGLEVALERGTLRAALLPAAAAAGQLFAGSGDLCVMTALACSFRLAVSFARREPVPRRRAVALAAATAAWAFLLAAVQVLPTAIVLAKSARRVATGSSHLQWSVHPLALTEVFVPRLLADLPLRPTVRAMLLDGREPFLASLYLGASTVPLVVLGILSRRRGARLLGVVGAFFVIAALGRHTPMRGLLLELPPLEILRYPVKYMVAAALCWSLLAAYGWQAWAGLWTERERRISALAAGLALVPAGAALAFAVLLWVNPAPFARFLNVPAEWAPVPCAELARKLAAVAAVAGSSAGLVLLRRRVAAAPVWATGALGVLVLCDLAATGRVVNPLGPRELLTQRPPVLEALGVPDQRVWVPTLPPDWLNRQLVRGPAGWDREWSFSLGLQEMLLPPIAARWGISGSYDANFTGLGPPRLEQISLLVLRAQPSVQRRLLQLGSVTHVVTLAGHAPPGLRTVGMFTSVFAQPITVLAVPDTLPRVYLAGRARSVSDDTAALSLLTDPSFDYRREVVLALQDEVDPLDAAEARGFDRATMRVVERRADRLLAEVDSPLPAYLVVTEAYERGWKARVDERPAVLSRANVLFCAVAVPAGRHRVEMTYRPPAVAWGAGMSAAGVALAIAALSGRRSWLGSAIARHGASLLASARPR